MNLLRPRARRLLLDALWAKSGHAAHGPGAGRRAAVVPRRGRRLRGQLHRLPERLVAQADPAGHPRRDGRRAAPRPLARRILNPGEVRRVARSLKRDGLSVHDVAMLDSSRRSWACPSRPRKRRELDPLDHSPVLELMPVREESRRRAERLAQERVEYAHVIVDEAQDLTPMQWRMVGRRGRQATWTVVGDPAQSPRGGPRRGRGGP